MASIRKQPRVDGSIAYRVYFRHNGRQTCYTFDDSAGPGTGSRMAETFCTAVNQLGAKAAIALHRIERAPRAEPTGTVTDWVSEYIEHLTGARPRTIGQYRAYLANDIAPVIGSIALGDLSDRDVARWIKAMTSSPKTIANKQRFLSGALKAAVKAGKIGANPAAGAPIPRGVKRGKVFLSRKQYGALLDAVTEPWRPLVGFLVASGCRWSEATMLYPTDVNRDEGSVRIWQSWNYEPGVGYVPGPTKTLRSERTINVPKVVLDELDYTGEYLFTNPGSGAGGPSRKRPGAGGPVRQKNFHRNVWLPACERAKLNPRPRIHDLRHTYASWMIQAGIPLPVIQQQLGHESIQTTVDVYGHLDRRSAQAAADVMGEMLLPEPVIDADTAATVGRLV